MKKALAALVILVAACRRLRCRDVRRPERRRAGQVRRRTRAGADGHDQWRGSRLRRAERPDGSCDHADTSGCAPGSELVVTDGQWRCTSRSSSTPAPARRELPLKVTAKFTTFVETAGPVVDLREGCAGDGTEAIDLILDIQGDGRTEGRDQDALSVKLNAHDIDITGNIDCGPRAEGSHQDGIQAQGGTTSLSSTSRSATGTKSAPPARAPRPVSASPWAASPTSSRPATSASAATSSPAGGDQHRRLRQHARSSTACSAPAIRPSARSGWRPAWSGSAASPSRRANAPRGAQAGVRAKRLRRVPVRKPQTLMQEGLTRGRAAGPRCSPDDRVLSRARSGGYGRSLRPLSDRPSTPGASTSRQPLLDLGGLLAGSSGGPCRWRSSGARP